MKQIIIKHTNGKVSQKYYINNSGQYYGLFISYWGNGNIYHKINFNNGKRYGLRTWYDKNIKIKITHQSYYL